MRMFITTCGTLLLLGCAQGLGSAPADKAEVARAVPVGAPIDCVDLAQIRESRVRDAETIDFVLRNGAVLRNRLPSQCPGLAVHQGISYNPTGLRLCSTDTITVRNVGGGVPGPTCGLGQFQQVQVGS